VDFWSYSWKPTWDDPADPAPVATPAAKPFRFLLATEAEVLSLGEAVKLSQHRTRLQVRQPVPGSDQVLWLGVIQDGRSVRARASDPYMESATAHTVTAGVELHRRKTVLGDWTLVGMASLDRAFAGSVSLENSSRFHMLRYFHWKSNARRLQFILPTENVTDVGEQHRVQGNEITAAVTLPIVRNMRVTLGGRLATGSVGSDSVEQDVFLTLSPVGNMRKRDLWLGLHLHDTDGLLLNWRQRETDLDAPFLRNEQGAGKLFFGRMDFSRWSVSGWRGGRSHRWEAELGHDELESALSARLETWPFTSIWEQLGAIAYRYRGDIVGRSNWVELTRAANSFPISGFRWRANVSVYDMETSQEDWLVTNLGFGRENQESSAWQVSTLVFLGGEVTRAFPVGAGSLAIRLGAAVPVYGRTADDVEKKLAGQVSGGITWSW
jgi:hypothetical protein